MLSVYMGEIMSVDFEEFLFILIKKYTYMNIWLNV